MVWTIDHDKDLCREIIVTLPFKHRHGSRERGQAWDSIAERLNSLDSPRFAVDQRGVRERYSKIEKRYKRRMAQEERASGIEGEELTEVEQAVETIIGMTEAAEEENTRKAEKKKGEVLREKETAESMRAKSMETLRETREREKSTESEEKRKKVSAGTLEYLRENCEKEHEIKKEELEMKREEIALKKR